MNKHEHIWTIKLVRGHEEAHCARCMQCMSLVRALRAYVQLHGGTVTP